jgi:transcription elongation factor SPT6
LKKRKRIKLQDDSSEDDVETREPQPKERKKPSKQKKSRERIEYNIQEVGEEVEELEQSEREQDEENSDNFIVDDSDEEGGGTSGVRKERRRKYEYNDDAQQEALDIFGVNADELGLGDSDEQEDEEEDEEGEYEDDEAFEGEEGEEDLDQVRRRQRARKLKSKKKLEDIFEPAELERNLLTEYDQQIRIEDKPERFMLRNTQVQPEPNDSELDREAEWIYKQLFDQKTTISQQESTYKPSSVIPKIRDVLNYMRNQFLEVPFIATYRKEYILPELNVDDLWRIYEYDEKYVQLKERKDNLVRLMQRMQKYQFEQLRALEPQMENLNLNEAQLRQLDAIRAIDDSDIDRIRNVQTCEEFMDCYQHFKIYYSSDIESMKKKENSELNEKNLQHQRKLALKKDRYHLCRTNGLASLAKKFGLTPEQFGENLLADYQKHDIDQESLDPMTLAQDYVSEERFNNCEQVLESARFMVATQLARDPNVKAYVRDLYMKRATICVRPTQKGFKEIDENHVCYAFKYLKEKPVISLKNEQFLRLNLAQEDKLIDIKFNVDSQEAFK